MTPQSLQTSFLGQNNENQPFKMKDLQTDFLGSNLLSRSVNWASVDFVTIFWYTYYMVNEQKRRKRRSDRTHVIYTITVAGHTYIGITAKTQSTIHRSVKVRLQKHFERARNEMKPWPLYKALRRHGVENASLSILATVRGKKAAHAAEVALIKKLKPELNLASA